MHALQDLNQFLRPFVKVPQSLCRGVSRIQLDRGLWRNGGGGKEVPLRVVSWGVWTSINTLINSCNFKANICYSLQLQWRLRIEYQTHFNQK